MQVRARFVVSAIISAVESMMATVPCAHLARLSLPCVTNMCVLFVRCVGEDHIHVRDDQCVCVCVFVWLGRTSFVHGYGHGHSHRVVIIRQLLYDVDVHRSLCLPVPHMT